MLLFLKQNNLIGFITITNNLTNFQDFVKKINYKDCNVETRDKELGGMPTSTNIHQLQFIECMEKVENIDDCLI